MQVYELIRLNEGSPAPMVLMDGDLLLDINLPMRQLIFPHADDIKISLSQLAQNLPELRSAMRSGENYWQCKTAINGTYWGMNLVHFQKTNGQPGDLSVISLLPLLWRGAPMGVSGHWLIQEPGGHQIGRYPMLINAESMRVSAPPTSLEALGLDHDITVAELVDQLRGHDRESFSGTLDAIRTESWRESELLDLQLFNPQREEWVRFEVRLVRLPRAANERWIAIQFHPVSDDPVNSQGQQTAIRGRVGSGSLVVAEILRYQDFLDVHGSEKAEALQSQIRAIFNRNLGEKDRMWLGAGNQFVVWFAGDTRGRRSEEFWVGVQRELERSLVFRDINQRFRIRGGYARAVNPESRAEHLIERAQTGLFNAAAGELSRADAGSSRSKDDAKNVRRRQAQLFSDFDEGRYSMIYQPISHPHDLKDPVGIEALSRSVSKSGEQFNGGEIVDAAVRHDFVKEWTLWGLDRLQADVSDWLMARHDRFVTFNVMPAIVVDQRNSSWFLERLAGMPERFRARLNLEITEQAIGHVINGDMISKIRDLGVAIYLDDFGAGESNLYRLIDIKPEAIKLDRFLIELMSEQYQQQDVLKQVIQLARSVSPRIIAEGIETQAQLDMVTDMGVDLVQGYFVGRQMDLTIPLSS
ncbi:EAL domain-containing protein [Litorivicinus lipolyticus]|uniref:EAL domain-containing protein n=1 Tax=Litorivicinus lipolyticus TaxID=418701 RepID=A0A5Q2QCI1_9GAMM|nr:EAL domain-containing protein [Litorivicinus lipolyticus]QGG80031.1 EAL domain-containing protein [Litorivicinus lipolyticus]